MLDHSLQAIRKACLVEADILMPNAHSIVVSYDYSIGLVVPHHGITNLIHRCPLCPGLPYTPVTTMIADLVEDTGVVAGEAEGDGAGVLFVDVVDGSLEMAEVVKVVAWGGLTVWSRKTGSAHWRC